MEAFIAGLLGPILEGSSPAVTALLMLLLVAMGYVVYKIHGNAGKERTELIAKFQKQIDDDRQDLLQVIDKYQAGQIGIVEALNEIRILIATIGAKL